jgi:hypothetical protein
MVAGDIIVGIIIAGVVLLGVRSLHRTLSGKSGGCGCSAGGCRWPVACHQAPGDNAQHRATSTDLDADDAPGQDGMSRW